MARYFEIKPKSLTHKEVWKKYEPIPWRDYISEKDRGLTEPCQEGGEHGGFWHASRWHQCRDGKQRRVPLEPALFPLAHGVPGRVGRLRAYGNAIVPQVAAQFIRAFDDVRRA